MLETQTLTKISRITDNCHGIMLSYYLLKVFNFFFKYKRNP